MGGCLSPQPPHGRQGNITPFAEFNFYMDASAAEFVLNSGIPVVLFPLDVTHQLVFSKSRQEEALEVLGTGLGEKLIQIMGAAATIDSNHFNLGGSVFHDECVILYLLEPELFRGREINLKVITDPTSERHGQLRQPLNSSNSSVLVMDVLLDSDRAFGIILDSLKSLLKK